MANTKISAAPAAGSFLATDEIPVNDAGTSKKVTGTQLATFIGWRKLDDQSTASAASLTLTVPAGTYNSLKIAFTGRSDQAGATNLQLQFNADTAGNYDYQLVQDLNATITSPAPSIAGTVIVCGVLVPTGAAAGAETFVEIAVGNADSATLRKQVKFEGGSWDSDAAAGARFLTGHAQWRNTTTAVASIKLFPPAGNLISAQAILYGCL